MGLYDLLKRTDINTYVEQLKTVKNGVLIDVRTPEEVRDGRIPGSLNIPLNEIYTVEEKIPDKDTPLFVHCHSGVRSGQAVMYLKEMGYSNVKNIGGIASYTGFIERG